MDNYFLELIDVKNNARDGRYSARISNAYIFQDKNGFSTVGIVYSFREGESLVEITRFVPAKLSKGNEIYDLMDSMCLLPTKVGQRADIRKMINQQVVITIKNNEKNGKRYSNIVSIEIDSDSDKEEIFNEEYYVDESGEVFKEADCVEKETDLVDSLENNLSSKIVLPTKKPKAKTTDMPRERKISP